MAVRATLDPVDLVRREARLRIEAGRLYLSEQGLALLLPPGVPLKLERITPGVLHVRVGSGLLSTSAQVRPRVTEGGLLRLEIGGLVGLFLPLIRDRIQAKPGIRAVDSSGIVIDLSEIAALAGIDVPPLRAARAGEAIAELEF
ncbi:MAG: hypothetical protein K0Q72_5250 [Armatimonadetes bacterium]|nr:hypothetical protein [Armatimonadota bacterium]